MWVASERSAAFCRADAKFRSGRERRPMPSRSGGFEGPPNDFEGTAARERENWSLACTGRVERRCDFVSSLALDNVLIMLGEIRLKKVNDRLISVVCCGSWRPRFAGHRRGKFFDEPETFLNAGLADD